MAPVGRAGRSWEPLLLVMAVEGRVGSCLPIAVAKSQRQQPKQGRVILAHSLKVQHMLAGSHGEGA